MPVPARAARAPAPGALRRVEPDDEGDDAELEDDEPGDVDDDELEDDETAIRDPDPPSPARSARPQPSPRQPTTVESTGTSFWLGKSREQLNEEAEERKKDMGNTKVGRSVKGLPTA